MCHITEVIQALSAVLLWLQGYELVINPSTLFLRSDIFAFYLVICSKHFATCEAQWPLPWWRHQLEVPIRAVANSNVSYLFHFTQHNLTLIKFVCSLFSFGFLSRSRFFFFSMQLLVFCSSDSMGIFLCSSKPWKCFSCQSPYQWIPSKWVQSTKWKCILSHI